MHAEKVGGREAGLGIARVTLDLIRHAQLLEQPEDAMRAGVLEVVEGEHGAQCSAWLTLWSVGLLTIFTTMGEYSPHEPRPHPDRPRRSHPPGDPAAPLPGRGARDGARPAVRHLAQLGVEAHPHPRARRSGAPPRLVPRAPCYLQPVAVGKRHGMDRAPSRLLDRDARRPRGGFKRRGRRGSRKGQIESPAQTKEQEMNDMTNLKPGTSPAPATVRLERLLPGPLERAWAYLIDAAKRKTWL